MAHFRAYVRGGAQGVGSRLGTKTSGIHTRVQTWGWDVDIDVINREDGEDEAEIKLIHHLTGECRSVGKFNLTTGGASHEAGR